MQCTEISRATGEETDLDHMCLEILDFMSRHPHTRFDQAVVVHIFGGANFRKVQDALDRLVAVGLAECGDDSGPQVYRLT